MNALALAGARILAEDGWRDDEVILVENGRIKSVLPRADLPAGLYPEVLDGGFLVPGFIDTQVNGGGGVLLNDQPDMQGIAAIAAAHRRFGTTALLPTLISDDLDVIAAAIGAVAEAIDAGVPGVVGIHIEGPFLNERKRGIHDARKFRRLDAAAIELVSSLRNGVTLLTLAPELADPGIIGALVARGVRVAVGHSMADYDQMRLAIAEGVSGVTHLFNAMTQMESRSPGAVGAALENKLYCGLIVDGHHVHPAAMRVALAASGPERLMLVTDAMPTVGSGSKHFKLGGRDITAEGGACRAGDGTLAGSDLDMAQAVRNAVALLGVDLSEASAMASKTPAHFLGIEAARGTIRAGLRADLVHLDDALDVQGVWIGGVRQ